MIVDKQLIENRNSKVKDSNKIKKKVKIASKTLVKYFKKEMMNKILTDRNNKIDKDSKYIQKYCYK